jgi:hypothetical protein
MDSWRVGSGSHGRAGPFQLLKEGVVLQVGVGTGLGLPPPAIRGHQGLEFGSARGGCLSTGSAQHASPHGAGCCSGRRGDRPPPGGSRPYGGRRGWLRGSANSTWVTLMPRPVKALSNRFQAAGSARSGLWNQGIGSTKATSSQLCNEAVTCFRAWAAASTPSACSAPRG